VELGESSKYFCVSSLVSSERFVPEKRLKQRSWYAKIVVESLEAEFHVTKT
jgi:hypothetical protein